MGSYFSLIDECIEEKIIHHVLYNFSASEHGFISSLDGIKNIKFKKNSNNVYEIHYFKNNEKHCFYAFGTTFFPETEKVEGWKYVLRNDTITVEEFPFYFKYYLHKDPTYKDWGKFFDLDFTKCKFILKNNFFETF